MSRTYSDKYNHKDYQDKRDRVDELKMELMSLIHPQKSYMPYFADLFPETNTDTYKRKIRNVMSGKTTCDDVIGMLEKIVNNIKSK